MTTVSSYQDLLDRDHLALVAECKRIDDDRAARRFKAYENRALKHVEREADVRHYYNVEMRRRYRREQEDALFIMGY